MNNFIKLFGIIALVTVIGFLTVTCDDGGDKGGPAFLGNTLKLSGQVYTIQSQMEPKPSISYQKFTDSLSISDDGCGGTGGITNGQFSYTIGTPTGLGTNWLYDFEDYDDVTASNLTAKGAFLSLGVDDTKYYGLGKSSGSASGSSSSYSYTMEYVSYVYVDNDVTISGKGKSHTNGEGSFTLTTKNFSLALKAGWNAIYGKGTISANSSVETYTVAISLGNPSLKWVLFEDRYVD